MKAIDSQPFSPLASQVLKLVGIILILSFFVDLLVLLIAPQFSDPQWQLNLMTQSIDRGVTPLIGFALLYAGFWMRTASGATPTTPVNRAAWQDSRFWTFVFASLLGLLFVLLIPLHFSTTNHLTQQATDSINQQAAQTEIQIEQQQKQLQSVVDSGQLDKLIQSNQVPPDQLAVLQQLKQDPKALDKQAEQARSQVRTRQNQAIDQAKSEGLTNRLRAELRSLLLAIGFITIGWSGLREAR
jgi:hypothetical protein